MDGLWGLCWAVFWALCDLSALPERQELISLQMLEVWEVLCRVANTSPVVPTTNWAESVCSLCLERANCTPENFLPGFLVFIEWPSLFPGTSPDAAKGVRGVTAGSCFSVTSGAVTVTCVFALTMGFFAFLCLFLRAEPRPPLWKWQWEGAEPCPPSRCVPAKCVPQGRCMPARNWRRNGSKRGREKPWP